MSERTLPLAERYARQERERKAAAAKQKQREATAAPFNPPIGLSGLRGASMPAGDNPNAAAPGESMFGGGKFTGTGAGRSAAPTAAPAPATSRGGAVPTQPTAAPILPPQVTEEHRRQADASPELAALKEAINSPAPVFQGLAFNNAEKAALGFLAGLRGIEAVLPIIEQRRKDATLLYETTREARAERIRQQKELADMEAGRQAESERQMERAEDIGIAGSRFERKLKQERELTEMRERGALERTKLAAGAKFPPGYAVARKERRDLDALRGEVRRAKAIIEKFPGLTGPMDQSLAMHPTAEGRKALREMESSLSTISSMMASTESGGKNLTSTELELFGGRFPMLSNLGGTVTVRLSNAERWLSGKISAIDSDFGFGAGGQESGIASPTAPPPEGFTDTDSFEMSY